jgi:hypothetical protein
MTGIEEGFPLLVFQLHVNAQVFLPERGGGNSQFFVQIGGVIQQVEGQRFIGGIAGFGQQFFASSLRFPATR